MSRIGELCQALGLSGHEERLSSALSRFGFGAEDITADTLENLRLWYDLDQDGVRMLLKAYILEFLSIFDGEAGFRVYASVPAPMNLCAALNAAGVRIHTAEFCAMVALRGILGLPLRRPDEAGCARCAMLENRREFLLGGRLPLPDMLWSFGLLCDECPKTDERIAQELPVRYMSTLCCRTGGDERFARYEAALRSDIAGLCHSAGVHVPRGEEARKEVQALSLLIGSITCRNNGQPCPPLKAGSLALIHSVTLTAFGSLREVTEALRQVWADIRTKPAGTPVKKLYCYYIPPCLPELGALFARHGVALVGDGAFLTAPGVIEHGNDLAGWAAASWRSAMLSRSVEENGTHTAQAMLRYGCHGYLTGQFNFDRWLGPGQKLALPYIEERTGRPVFQYDTDFWGGGYRAEHAATYVESAACMLD